MNRTVTALAISLACATPALPANVTITDGDTIVVDGEKIRLLDIDTPETFRSRCENELKLGLAAKELLRALITDAKITVIPDGKDVYGRTLASVYADNVNLGEMLLTTGHALPYNPGNVAKLARLRVWCGPHAELTDTWSRTK